MDFTLSSEQQALRESLGRFLDRELDWDKRMKLLREGEAGFARIWSGLVELGCTGAGIDEDRGGYGGDPVDMALIAEELGRVLAPVPYAPFVMAVSLLTDARATDAAPLAELVSGARLAIPALLERDARGDLLEVRAVAEPVGSGFRLTGRKTLVEGARQADCVIVSATIENAAEEGPALFVVEADAAGVRRLDYRTIDNRPVSDIGLEGVQVDASARLLTDGRAAIDRAADAGAVMICAQAVGAMDAALWMTRDYLRMRRQFGVPLASFQALQHRMADMLIETELARSMLFQALAALESDDRDVRRMGVSAAKRRIGEAGVFVGAQAIQLHGGIGMTEEYAIGHYYKHLFAGARTLGDGDFHLQRFIRARDGLVNS